MRGGSEAVSTLLRIIILRRARTQAQCMRSSSSSLHATRHEEDGRIVPAGAAIGCFPFLVIVFKCYSFMYSECLLFKSVEDAAGLLGVGLVAEGGYVAVVAAHLAGRRDEGTVFSVIGMRYGLVSRLIRMAAATEVTTSGSNPRLRM